MVFIRESMYLDFLSKFGVGGAHPGGLDLTQEILKNEKISESSRILDVGCGTGQTAAYLADRYGASIIGMDINPIMIDKAKKRIKQCQLPVEIIQGSIENCPLPDGQFDLILSESVLAFADKPRSLHEIFRLLKQGGRFVANELTINQQLNSTYTEEIQQFYGLDSVFTEKDWLSLLEKTGFTDIKTSIQKPSMLENNPSPEFQFSEHIEPHLYMIPDQHLYMMTKYRNILDYRVFSCTKE
ncbi:class I SAM-dependent methyltransferase [Bacillus badius]|nr:class I SAM-dependent methyltransferase [Bacillus badius]MED4716750.1 class I SAM-dependent methyltransferase [Bacillus badius]